MNRMTLAALHEMKVCGWIPDREGRRMNRAASDASGYAIEAMIKAFDACDTGENKWEPDRGDIWPFLDRLVRRLVTDDKTKYTKRKPVMSLDDHLIDLEAEEISQDILNEAYARADDDLKEFILDVLEEVETDGSMNWADFQEQKGCTRYACDKLRKQLAHLIQNCADPVTSQSFTGTTA